MKKLFLSILTLLVFNYSHSQITVTKSAVESTKPNEPYDRLINFLGVDYHKYIGQELYLVPKRESLRNSGYEGFFINYKKKTNEESNKYNCCSGLNSMHEGLAGAYFIVKDIIEPTSENKYIFFNLYRKDTEETIYYKYNPKYESNFPFLVVIFIQKQKEIFVNKDIMIRNYYKTGNKNPKKIFDINTGEEIIIEKGKCLKCIDLTIESKLTGHFAETNKAVDMQSVMREIKNADFQEAARVRKIAEAQLGDSKT